MVAFRGVARALRCAVQIQRSFLAYSEAHGDHPIRVHIGIHTGEAVEEDDDVFGHTVIVASRIADTASAGEIVVSTLPSKWWNAPTNFGSSTIVKPSSRVWHAHSQWQRWSGQRELSTLLLSPRRPHYGLRSCRVA